MATQNVISLWQPWAMLWALGEKMYETRHWRFPRRFLYLPLGIHAAQKWNSELAEYCQMRPFKEAFERHLDIVGEDVPDQIGVTYHMVKISPDRYIKLPFGCLIGSVKVLGDLPTNHALKNVDASRRAQEDSFGDYSDNRWAWIGSQHRVLESYIPMKDAQRFFTYTTEKAKTLFDVPA